jgi:prevent-host-death family protein
MPSVEPSIGTRDLRAALSTHLRRAQNGERIVVTVDGKPVAQVGPIEAPALPTLADLIAVGLIEPPRRSDRPQAPAASELPTGLSAARALAELRGR